MSRSGSLVLLIVCASLASSCPAVLAGGGLNPEVLVSTGVGLAGDPDLVVGPGDTTLVAYVEDGGISAVLAPEFGVDIVEVTAGPGDSSPTIYLSFTGVTTVAFQREDGSPSALGDEIFSVQNPGGPFGTPINLSSSLASDRSPRITGGATLAGRSVSWIEEGAAANSVLVSVDLAPPAVVAEGDESVIHSEPGGSRHLIYTRSGGVYYRFDPGTGFGPEVSIPATAGAATHPALAVDGVDGLHVVYEELGDVYYSNRSPGGSFSVPVNVTQSLDASVEPSILAGPSGLHILYREAGDLWRISAIGTVFLPAANLTLSPAEEELDAAYALDSLGYLHLAYTLGGDVYYRNEVLSPVAAFDVSPAVGEGPLEVAFDNQSSGVVTSWSWSFGDGTGSTAESPVHVYESTGTYSVTLTATGPGGTDSIAVDGAVQVIDPTNFLEVARTLVFRNQSGVYIPILGTNSEPIQGFQVAVQWECGVIEAEEMTTSETRIDEIAPEFEVYNIDPAGCYATFGVVFDFVSPFDGRTFAPSVAERFANVICSIPGSAPLGVSTIELINGLGTPPIFNIFTVGGVSVLPVLIPGEIEVVPFTFPPPTVFYRGDVDSSGSVEVTDAINLLAFLFSGGPGPACPDAADVNDNGAIDVSDVVYLLSFLFAQGSYPPPPYPNLGLDPTEDPLGDC